MTPTCWIDAGRKNYWAQRWLPPLVYSREIRDRDMLRLPSLTQCVRENAMARPRSIIHQWPGGPLQLAPTKCDVYVASLVM